MRDVALAVFWGVVLIVVVLVVPAVWVYSVMFVQRKGWIVKLKNLIGGVFFAAMVAVVLAKTSIYIECSYYPWCWPFAHPPVVEPMDRVGK